jgi:hypothetical protein
MAQAPRGQSWKANRQDWNTKEFFSEKGKPLEAHKSEWRWKR